MERIKERYLEGFDLGRALKKLYAEDNNHKSQAGKDLACWFNLFEFAEFHNIDGHKILAVFTSDTRSSKYFSPEIEGISKSHGILFLRSCDVENVNAEQPMRLDGRLYTVDEAIKLGGVIWRISLSANLG